MENIIFHFLHQFRTKKMTKFKKKHTFENAKIWVKIFSLEKNLFLSVNIPYKVSKKSPPNNFFALQMSVLGCQKIALVMDTFQR